MVHRIFIYVGFVLTIVLAVFIFVKAPMKGQSHLAEVVKVVEDKVVEVTRSKVEPIYAKGLYVTAYSANSPVKRAEIIDLIESTELNTVVVDIKDYTGYILYKRDNPDAQGVWLYKEHLQHPREVIRDFHDHGIYVIARQTVMQDPVYAETFPEFAVKRADGGVWRDYKGLAWVDPTRQEIWDYNVMIAKDAIDLGFDEINFDYVRFPSDGNMATARYSKEFVKRFDVMRDFYEYMWNQLKDEPAYVSFDLFGLTLDNKDFDLNIGQRMTDVIPHAHYVSPMIYPSHYPAGYAGIQNPAAYPYDVIHATMSAGQQHYVSTTGALMRPWLQAFNIGAVYNADRIRAQIRAVEEQDNVAGWFLWNARNVYSTAGLKLEDHVSH